MKKKFDINLNLILNQQINKLKKKTFIKIFIHSFNLTREY